MVEFIENKICPRYCLMLSWEWRRRNDLRMVGQECNLFCGNKGKIVCSTKDKINYWGWYVVESSFQYWNVYTPSWREFTFVDERFSKNYVFFFLKNNFTKENLFRQNLLIFYLQDFSSFPRKLIKKSYKEKPKKWMF